MYEYLKELLETVVNEEERAALGTFLGSGMACLSADGLPESDEDFLAPQGALDGNGASSSGVNGPGF